ncbi:MAG: DUF58 domain-containing protein [Rhodocyclaceae bacterium]|nr:DUF58 domain-containing protein [Rhodocyclaceae bacterium]
MLGQYLNPEAMRQRFYLWALRSRPPEPVPIFFSQRRVYVLPTRAGLVFGLALIVMMLGAINYTLSLGHALVFLLAGLGIATILATFRNLVHLRVTTGRCEPVFAGEAACFGLILHNVRAAGRYDLRLHAGEGDWVHCDIPANASVAIKLPLPTQRRGWLELPRVTIETRWPLGLVRTWGYLQPALRCLVYPTPAHAAPPLPIGSGDHHGRHRQGRGSDDFAGLRRHQTGDALHHVAWKSAARQPDADLQTKYFAGENSEALWLDWAELPPTMDTETRLALLVHWALEAERAGLAWGLRLPQREFSPDRGDAHLHRCLETLALYGQA